MTDDNEPETHPYLHAAVVMDGVATTLARLVDELTDNADGRGVGDDPLWRWPYTLADQLGHVAGWIRDDDLDPADFLDQPDKTRTRVAELIAEAQDENQLAAAGQRPKPTGGVATE